MTLEVGFNIARHRKRHRGSDRRVNVNELGHHGGSSPGDRRNGGGGREHHTPQMCASPLRPYFEFSSKQPSVGVHESSHHATRHGVENAHSGNDVSDCGWTERSVATQSIANRREGSGGQN